MVDIAEVQPAIKELFKPLPDPGADFPMEQRDAFFRSISGIFDLLYPAPSVAKSIGQEAHSR